MTDVNASFYLPVSHHTLQDAINQTGGFASWLAHRSVAEIASLLIVNRLPSMGSKFTLVSERLLANLVSTLSDESANVYSDSHLVELAQEFSRKNLMDGYACLPEYNIQLLDDYTVQEQEYLNEGGLWDYRFKDKFQTQINRQLITVAPSGSVLRLNTEQSRVVRDFNAQNDENIYIHGYAGTGKTTLIQAILSAFNSVTVKILVLANSQWQLNAHQVNSHTGSTIEKYTFDQLARMIMPTSHSADNKNASLARQKNYYGTLSDGDLISFLSIKGTSQYRAEQIVLAVRATVYRFCQSQDKGITSQHIPISYASLFDSASIQAVTYYANALWQGIVFNDKQLRPLQRAYHRIKWAAINEWTVPKVYTHIVIDECHDIPPPIAQILNNSPQPKLSLGDAYQKLDGVMDKQYSSSMNREMNHSVRSSYQLDAIVNPLLLAHPQTAHAPFIGNKDRRLHIEYYDKPVIPAEPFVILVNDSWGLFEWAQRLASQKCCIQLLGDHKNLNMFAQDCIELFARGTRARHGELFRFRSWADVVDYYQANPDFDRISRMLERHYTFQHWKSTYQQLFSKSDNAYKLASIYYLRNQEFDNVMLTSGALRSIAIKNRAERVASLYVTVTRAKKRLFVPASLREWIEDVVTH